MSTPVTSDLELFEKFQAGDKTAFDEIYHRYWKMLYAQALRKTGDKDDAVDLVQELFTDIWSRRETLKITHTLEGYLKSALFYNILKYFHLRGFNEKHLKDFQAYALNLSGATQNIDAHELQTIELQYEKLMEVIHATINQMPHRMQLIFRMSRFQEHTIAEIAAQLNISPQTVKNQINEAFTRLRQATENYSVNISGILFLLWLGNS